MRALCFVLLLILPGLAAASERVALVIGMSDYETVVDLDNTLNDARDIGDTLTRIGFEVTTVLDRERRYLTAYLAPDRPAILTRAAVATNHQEKVEWTSHARFTATVERERYLLQRLTLHVEPEDRFVAAFLKPPLYSLAFAQGFGTLYTAVYHPARGRMALHWPGAEWSFGLDGFEEGARRITYPAPAPAAFPAQ
jgi:hypothetical protein